MKRLLRSFGLASALMAGSMAAHASYITVDGFSWDPASPLNFQANSAQYEILSTGTGTYVSGYGVISSFNTDTPPVCAGCQLAFVFNSYLETNALTSPVLTYTGGQLDLYVIPTGTANAITGTGYTSSKHFLSLQGIDITNYYNFLATIGASYGLTGSLFSTYGSTGGSAGGFLNVVGGDAQANFDTNTYTAYAADGTIIHPDISFTNSFQPIATLTSGANAFGSADIKGYSVPEPATLAMMGLGLAGIGVARRRRRS